MGKLFHLKQFDPDTSLTPTKPVFDEAWQAQTLAIADAMIRAGIITATQWAETLGAELKLAATADQPDTLQTYYTAALNALEQLITDATDLSQTDLHRRKSDWEEAYRRTPHGHPVTL